MIKQTPKEQVEHLPGQVLLDLARNEAASHAMRKAAVELLLDKHWPQVNHPELRITLMEIRAERAAKGEVESIVEAATETPADPGPFKASVTTETLQKNEGE